MTFAGAPWGGTGLPVLSSGQISGSLATPGAALVGVNQIVATQVGAALSSTTTFTVVSRALTLTPSTGPRGTQVLLTGSSMSPGSKIVSNSLKFGAFPWNTGSNPEPGNISIDTTGVISPTTLYVQSAFIAGVNTVTAQDLGLLISTGTFTITTPTIAINPATGPAGTTVVVTGSGWVTNTVVNNVVTITLKNSGLVAVATQNVTPDTTGNIAATITVPASATPGTYTITAGDVNSNTSSAFTFTVPGSAITVSPNSGMAGDTAQLSGTGFRGYFPITVTIGGYPLTSQALTTATGTFTVTFTVPGLAPGVQVILATDQTNTATTFYTLAAAPVSVGVQLSGISSQLVRVWGYGNGTWYLYDPADLAGSNLTTLTGGGGYWVNVSPACTLIYGAYSYPLSAGWNLIGWR